MNDNRTPGWTSFAEVAKRSGAAPKSIEKWAAQIKPDQKYAPNGWIYGIAEEEKTVKGSKLVRKVDGQWVMCNSAAEGWVETRRLCKELGLSTVTDFAYERGINEEELRQALERVRAEELGVSRSKPLEGNVNAEESQE